MVCENNFSKAYEEELRVKNVFYADFPRDFESRVAIARAFRGKNFMTPEIIGYTKSPKGYAVEVSCGRGFSHEIIFGVTFKTMSGREVNDDPSRCCYSYAEVKELIREN